MIAERLTTLVIVIFGLVFMFWVLPGQVETVEYGRIVPATLPMAVLAIITVAAVWQLIVSKQQVILQFSVCLRVAGFIIALILAVWLMDRFSFEYVAPIFSLSIMLVIGERRWYWLLFGGIVLPSGIWLLVERVLDRVLA